MNKYKLLNINNKRSVLKTAKTRLTSRNKVFTDCKLSKVATKSENADSSKYTAIKYI